MTAEVIPNFPGIFDTNTLIGVVPNLKTAKTFLLDEFFGNIVQSDSEFVSIDIDVGKRRLSPFVSPLVEGKLVEQRRIQTNIFKPPYIKDKRAPDLRKPVRRMLGERIGGGPTDPIIRAMQNLEFEMADQIDMIHRTLEWQAAQALVNGTITFAGDGFPTTTIDFGRNASLTITLTGTALWDSGNAAATPAFDIDIWSNTLLKASGAVATDIIFTPTPWNYFTSDPKVVQAIISDTSRFAYPNKNQVQMASEPMQGAILKGVWGGYRLWVYNDWYVQDSNNTEVRMVADGIILMVSRQIMGTRAFASILDPELNYAGMPYAPKTWTTQDPAQRLIMMQSSPLVIPYRINACLAATVTAANLT